MINFSNYYTFITEGYKNLIGDDDGKAKYADDVWRILQNSYKSIGGIKGNGFNSKDDMIRGIPFWKVLTSKSKVVGVLMYKDRGGRKLVASGTDGSPEAKKLLVFALKPELSRSYGEKSKASLGFLMKAIPFDELKPFLKTPDQVSTLTKDPNIKAVAGLKDSDIPEDAKITLSKYPNLIEFGYLRNIGGKMIFKVMVGTPNKSVLT